MTEMSERLSKSSPELALQSNPPSGLRRSYHAVAKSISKRLFDILVSGMAILFLAPVLLAVALLVKFTSPGPVIFRQQRAGLHGKAFYIFKFRSMTVTESGETAVQAQQNDKRVTPVGRFIRKTSLDELPQLFNILMGHMSLVGPRPHATGHDKQFSRLVNNYEYRFNARPGLTGLAQVRGYRGEIVDNEAILKRVASDAEYIDSWTIVTDLLIILRTVPLIFADKKAF